MRVALLVVFPVLCRSGTPPTSGMRCVDVADSAVGENRSGIYWSQLHQALPTPGHFLVTNSWNRTKEQALTNVIPHDDAGTDDSGLPHTLVLGEPRAPCSSASSFDYLPSSMELAWTSGRPKHGRICELARSPGQQNGARHWLAYSSRAHGHSRPPRAAESEALSWLVCSDGAREPIEPLFFLQITNTSTTILRARKGTPKG